MKARFVLLASLAAVLTAGAVTGISLLLAPGEGRPTSQLEHRCDMPGFVPGPGPDVVFGDDNVIVPDGDAMIFDDPIPAGIPAPPGVKGVPAERMKEMRGAFVGPAETRVSRAFTHENLAVFLVHGPSNMADDKIITLQEGLDAGLVTVHADLTVTNRSDKSLFIQSGDIVKGGTQDRVIPYDNLIPARAIRQPMGALCVESGRSFPRGGEASAYFHTSSDRLPTTDLRKAAFRRDQGAVWANVAKTQDALSRALGVPVRSSVSSTSLQLAPENHVVRREMMRSVDELLPAMTKEKDAIGLVVVINGRIISADVYASSGLFERVLPRLLRAAATEALLSRGGPAATAPVTTAPTEDVVRSFLTVSESTPGRSLGGAGRLDILGQETTTALIYDACDRDSTRAVLHRTILVR